MVIRYFDASALAKRCLEEAESPAVSRWFVEGRPATSTLGILEVTSAVARRTRSGALDGARSEAALAILAEDSREMLLIEVERGIVDRARTVVLRHGLRAADAVHLATALRMAERSRTPVVLVAFDGGLLRAARAEGLRTLGGK